MTRVFYAKTSFTAGELSPRLYGRSDLRAYENGAAELINVVVHPTGGLSRRAGLKFIAEVAGAGRLVAFEFNKEQTYLLVFGHLRVDIYRGDQWLAWLATPWQASQLSQISWTQSADTLLVLHPDVAPRKILRTGTSSWAIEGWSYYTKGNRTYQPYHNFAPEVRLTYLSPSGSYLDPRLSASTALFTSAHLGTKLLFRAEVTSGSPPAYSEFTITQIINAQTVLVTPVVSSISNNTSSADWLEQAFSPARGWPMTAAFHQDRLVIGGSRDLPHHLWMSKTSDLFNFDFGTGKDDEAIHFQILSDQVNSIRAIIPGRHLQVMTSGAEWTVAGEPMTPATVQVMRQTRIGSRSDRWIPPRDLGGVSLFVARDGKRLNEFVFTDTEQAYAANDLTILADHLLSDIIDLDINPATRQLYVVDANRGLACLTLNRGEQVAAWTRFATAGTVLSLAAVDDKLYLLVARPGGVFIECLSDDFYLDAAAQGTRLSGGLRFSGFEHLAGEEVSVLIDDRYEALLPVNTNGTIDLAIAANKLIAGKAYEHSIAPLPPVLPMADGINPARRLRLLRAVFRLLDTGLLNVTVGGQMQRFRLLTPPSGTEPPGLFSGDKSLRGLGWWPGGTAPLWRISGQEPYPFSLLSVTTETKVND